MTCGEQVAWLEAMQSISMAMGGGPLAVLGRCCNRGDWKPEYDGEKLHVSRPHELKFALPSEVRHSIELLQANKHACARTHANRTHMKGGPQQSGRVDDSRSYFVIHATDGREKVF